MSYSHFTNPDYDFVLRSEMDARDHVVDHMLPLLKKQGIEGRPLYTLHDDGRLTAHVILRVPANGGDLPVLAPVTLLGTGDLSKYAEVKGDRHRAGTYYKAGDRLLYSTHHPSAICPHANAVREADLLPLFCAHLLGADPRDRPGADVYNLPLREIARYGEESKVFRIHEVAGNLIDFGSPVLDRQQVEALRRVVENDLRHKYACLDGTVVKQAYEPEWIVTCQDNGRVKIGPEASSFNNASEPVSVDFSIGCRDEAFAFAEYMASLWENGRVVPKGTIEEFRPDLTKPYNMHSDTMDLAKRLLTMLEHVSSVIPAPAMPYFSSLRAFIKDEKHGHPWDTGPWEGRDRWLELWKPMSAALGDTNPDLTAKGHDRDTPVRRWATRLHMVRSALDYLADPKPALRKQPPSVPADDRVDAPFDIPSAEAAVKSMSELLVHGGEDFVVRWTEARDAVGAFRSRPDRANAERAEAAVIALASAVPEAFPSAPAAGRWAMKTRPVLKEIAESLTVRPSGEHVPASPSP